MNPFEYRPRSWTINVSEFEYRPKYRPSYKENRKHMKYSEDEIVQLLPFEDEPAQKATILVYQGNGLYTVALLPEFITEDGDDGIRECDEDQIEKIEK